MSLQNKSRDGQRSEELKSEVRYAVPAFEDIRKDLGTLQSDVASLAADVKKVGVDKANEAVSYVNDQIDSLKDAGSTTFEKLEDRIKSRPGQSITIAFVVGIVASYLFGRRS